MPKNRRGSKRPQKYCPYSSHSQKSTNGSDATTTVSKNPLQFPGCQVKLAGQLLDRGVGPNKLSELFEAQDSLEVAEKKTQNNHRLSAFLMSEWVLNSKYSYADSLAKLFDDKNIRKIIKSSCGTMIGTEKAEFPPCSRGKKSFTPLKLLICQNGELIAVCSNHGIPKGKKSWCYYKKYNEETEKASTKLPIASACSSSSTESGGFLRTHCRKLIQTFSSDPGHFSANLFQENLLSEKTLEEVRVLNITNTEKAEKLHSALLCTVQSCKHYEKLASIFEESQSCTDILNDLRQYLSLDE